MSDSPWPRAVGMRKFVLMSFFTMGIYDVYWFYWNWRRQRERIAPRLEPGLLAFLSPVTAYVLFRDVRRAAGALAPWNPALLAAAYFAMVMCFLGSAWLFVLTWLSFIPLMPVQATINRMHEAAASAESRDDSLSALNIGGMVVGAAFMALLIFAALTIDQEMIEETERQLRVFFP